LNKENSTTSRKSVFNIPNTISWLRIALTVVIVLLMYFGKNLLAFVFFLIASISDYFDGYLARRLKQVTSLGKVLDQMSDKILITSILVVFVELHIVPSWLVVIIILRDTLVSVVRMLASESGRIVAANIFGKLKTVSQMILTIGLYIQLLGFRIEVFNTVLIYFVAVVTVLSGAIYLYQNREFLNK